MVAKPGKDNDRRRGDQQYSDLEQPPPNPEEDHSGAGEDEKDRGGTRIYTLNCSCRLLQVDPVVEIEEPVSEEREWKYGKGTH